MRSARLATAASAIPAFSLAMFAVGLAIHADDATRARAAEDRTIDSRDVRLVLLGITTIPSDHVRASFLVTRRIDDGHGRLACPDQAMPMTAEIGQNIGEPVVVVSVGGKRRIEDMTTPFRLEEIDEDRERVLRFQIRAVRGTSGHSVQMTCKVRRGCAVVVEDQRTHARICLHQVCRIASPLPPFVHHPDHGPAEWNEMEEFARHPELVQAECESIAEPIRYAQGTGPLAALRDATGDQTLVTDTPYYACADGRLVFWDPTLKSLRVAMAPRAQQGRR